MHPEYIKTELKLLGITPSDLSRELGLNRNSVTCCLNGHFRSERIEKAVADTIGKPLHVVFPERYSVDGAAFAS